MTSLVPQILLVCITSSTLTFCLRQHHEGDSSNPLSVGGSYINHGECPWLCPLFYEEPGKNAAYFCGTSLITNQHVLTGEFCLVQ